MKNKPKPLLECDSAAALPHLSILPIAFKGSNYNFGLTHLNPLSVILLLCALFYLFFVSNTWIKYTHYHAHESVLFSVSAESRLTHSYSEPLQSRRSNDAWPWSEGDTGFLCVYVHRFICVRT